jgi:hypothetical protein
MKKNYVRNAIQRGLVITALFEDIAAYPKFYVLMGLEQNFLKAYGFFINSDLHPLSRNKFILRTQVEIPQNSYTFLTKPQTSYVNCQDPYPIDFSEMVNALLETPSKICGHLNPLHLQNIITAVLQNRTFTFEQRTLLTRQFILPANFLV